LISLFQTVRKLRSQAGRGHRGRGPRADYTSASAAHGPAPSGGAASHTAPDRDGEQAAPAPPTGAPATPGPDLRHGRHRARFSGPSAVRGL